MIFKYAKRSICIFALSMGFVYAEPSVYGFGSDEYSDNEPSSVQDSSTIASLRQQIAQQNERLDGLTTIIEGLSASINELQIRRDNTSSAGNDNASSDAVLKKLAEMIDKINQNYVTKDELQKSLGNKHAVVRENKVLNENTIKAPKDTQDSLQNESSATLYNEGVRHFVKQRYAEAQKRFTLTDTKGYKPAASNYYLGEIAYYTNKYQDAIFYFKKSAGLHDQASYIDTLLLHTAISLENTGDKAQAKIFYENIIQNYAEKKTAQIAKQRLKRL